MVLHATLPIIPEKIESQAVVLKVSKGEKFTTKEYPLVILQHAFKHRILHALPMIEAGLGHLAQALLALGRTGGDIIANKDKHG